MDSYADLNVANPQLASFAKSLGWAVVRTARVVDVRVFRDIPQHKQPSKPGAERELVVVQGDNTDLLRQAVTRDAVDLVNPTMTREYYRDDGLIRAVATAGKAFEIPLSHLVLNVTFAYRARNLMQLRQFLAKCRKLRAKFVLTSRAKSTFDVKTPRETIAIGTLLGLSREQAEAAITLNQ